MSGEKHAPVRIYPGEYNRLMSSAQEVDNLRQRESARARQLEEAQRQIRRNQEEHDRRQKAFEQSVNKLSNELQATTRDFQRRLNDQQKAFDQGFKDLGRRIDAQRTEYLDLIARQTEQFNQQFDRIEQKERDAAQYAKQWQADTQIILDYIAQNLRHQQFTPGELAKLQTEQAMTQGNIQQGHYQAAIATGQALYGKALALQAEIEYRQAEWDAYYAEAQKGGRKLLAECETRQTSQWALDTEQGSETLDAEIDYWSNGALSRLRQTLEQHLEKLGRERETITLEQLKSAIAQNDQWQSELEQIVAQAKENLIASQLRVNLAQDLLDELAKSGWQIEDSAWEGSEQDQQRGWKSSYHVKLKNLGDDEMITIISPEPTPQGQIENRLQFAYYPKNNNDAKFAANQTASIQRLLVERGLTQESLRCTPGHERTIRGDEHRRDFARVRQSVPSTGQNKS